MNVKQIGITTNGVLLPRRLKTLKDAGLTHLNVSLDTLIKPRFELITRRLGLERVLQGLDLALELGLQSVKVTLIV